MHLTKLSLPLAAMAISRVGAENDFIDCTNLVEGPFDPEFERLCIERAVGGRNTKFEGLLFNAFSLMSNSFVAGSCPDWRTINAKCNNVANTAWGAAGQTMPRSVGPGESSSDAGEADVYDVNRWATYGGAVGGQTDANGDPVLNAGGTQASCTANNSNDWGGNDPRDISDSVCKQGIDYQDDAGGASGTVPDDEWYSPYIGSSDMVARSDSVITYAQVMDHELDATGPKAGLASDSGCAYPFGGSSNLAGKFKRSNDAADNGITSYVDAGIVYGETNGERTRLRGQNSNGGAGDNELEYTCLENTGSGSSGMHGTCAVTAQYLPDSKKICGSGSTCTTQQLFMANPTKRACFYAGDFRANENPALLAYHTLFMRMHNWIEEETEQKSSWCQCNSYFGGNSFDSPSTCEFETIRHKVGYEEQYITYNEWLPAYTGTWGSDKFYSKLTTAEQAAANGAVLQFAGSFGKGGMEGWVGYQPGIRGEVRHVFATATFRHHTGVNHTMQLASLGGQLELDQTYFESCVWVGNKGPGCESQQTTNQADDSDVTTHGIAHLCDILAGQSTQAAKRGDTIMLTEQRNQLFYKVTDFGNTNGSGTNNGESGVAGFEGFGGDLSTLNMARGRDHNIAGYKKAFESYFGVGTAPSMATIHTYNGLDDNYAQEGTKSLANVYTGGIDHVDLWTGALAEAKLGNGGQGISMLGTILTFDVVTQFQDLRDGDRFWYENVQNGVAPGGSVYGAPARCDNDRLRPDDNRGLAAWVQQLTGATGFSASLNPFQVQQISCEYNDGQIQEHTIFNDVFTCGSGAKGGNVVYQNPNAELNEEQMNELLAEQLAAAQAQEEAEEAVVTAAQAQEEAQEAKNGQNEVAREHKHKVHKRMH